MEYNVFKEKYKNKSLNLYINNKLALRAISEHWLPNNYYWAHTFFSWLWLLSIPLGLYMLFVNIGKGILILFFVSYLGGKVIKKTASQFVVDYSLVNEDFYYKAIEAEILVVADRN